MAFSCICARPVVYSIVLLCFSASVTGSLSNSQFQYLTNSTRSDFNSMIDGKENIVGWTNPTKFVDEGKASLIIHPKKQLWVEQIARKLAPFFSVISFWNEKCWTAGYNQGTCYSRKDCIAKGGTPNGMCAAGFGVCCVFSYSCDSSTIFNRTYFLNPEYPYPIHQYGICPHSIHKLNDICQIRLDFEVMELARPNKHGSCEADMFTIQGTDFHMPPLCGDLTGHHLYLPVGYDQKITLQISLLSGNPWARWKIRTTKIKCSSNTQAPPGCQQHLFGAAGRITSFNYYQGEESNMNHLNYGVCVRKERGFCAIQWTLCDGGGRKRRSIKSPGEPQFDVQRKLNVTNSGENEIPFPKNLKTTSHGGEQRSFFISRSYAGIHVSRPRAQPLPLFSGGREEVIGCRSAGFWLANGTFQNPCPPDKGAIIRKNTLPPPDNWRPFVPQPNYFLPLKPQQGVKLEHRTLELQIGTDGPDGMWTNPEFNPAEVGLGQVNNEINSHPQFGLKNPSPRHPITKYKYQDPGPGRLIAVGSESPSSSFTSHSNPIPNGNQVHYLRDKPYLKSSKGHYGIGDKVVGIKAPFYTKSSATASASVQAQGTVSINPGKPSASGFTAPIHHKPKPIHTETGYFPPTNVQHKPTFSGAGAVQQTHAKPKPTFAGTGGGIVPPIHAGPKPTFTGAAGIIPPINAKPKPTLLGSGGGLGGLLTSKIKAKPKPLGNNGFGLLGRPKVKPKPTLQYKPWGFKNKHKNKGNGTCKPKILVVPVPIPLPIPIPIPIVPVVVVPFPFGGGGGGGGGHGHGWKEDDDHHKVISTTEPYIIRIVTDDEREEGLSSFCMDWEQIPCDIWWTHHPKFHEHEEL